MNQRNDAVDPAAAQPSRYSAAQFLVALVLLICASPVLEDFAAGKLVEALLLTLVLVSAVPAVGGGRRTVTVASLLALPAVAGKWLHHLRPDLLGNAPILVAAIVFAIFVVVHHFLFILRATEVDTQVLCAGISAFLMLGLLWAFGYLLVDNVAPESFGIQMGPKSGHRLTGFGAVYFSFGTLSGMSFGEITPLSNVTRMLALLEAMTSLFYLAILISRLVALHMEHAARERGGAGV
jgi:hypothetical protein